MTQAELETLMVRLVGDTTQYVQQMAAAQKANDAFEASTKKAIANMTEYKRRMDLGWTGRRIEDTTNFVKSEASALSYGSALKGLAAAYFALRTVQIAGENEMIRFHDRLKEGDALSQRLAAAQERRVSIQKSIGGSLQGEDQRKFYQQQRDMEAKNAEEQAKALENAKAEKEKALTATNLPDWMNSQFTSKTAKDYAAAALRHLPGAGDELKAQLEAAEKAINDETAALERSIKARNEYDQMIRDSAVGGKNATMAYNQSIISLTNEAVTMRMTSEAAQMYNLALKNLSPEQLAVVENQLKMNKAMSDAAKENQRIQNEIYAEEDSRKSRAKSLEDSLSTNNPFDKYKAEVKELNELFKEGLLGPTVYLRGIQQASNSLDRATQSAARFKEVNSSLFGSFQGQQEFKSYLESLSPQTNNPNAFPIPSLPSGRIEGFGNGEAALKVLNEIKDALKKDNEPKVVVRPANVGGG